MKRGAEEAEGAPRCAEKPSAAHLRGLGLGYVRFALAHPGHFRIMFRPELKALLRKNKELAVDEAFGLLESAITRCQAEGILPAGDHRPLVLVAWSTVHGASVLWVDGPLSGENLVQDAESLAPVVADTLARLLFGP